MIFSKILYDNDNAAEAIFVGHPEDYEIEIKAILDSARKDDTLRPILLKVMNEIADRIEEELRNERK